MSRNNYSKVKNRFSKVRYIFEVFTGERFLCNILHKSDDERDVLNTARLRYPYEDLTVTFAHEINLDEL